MSSADARKIAALICNELELCTPETLTERINKELSVFLMHIIKDRMYRRIEVQIQWGLT